MSFTVCQSHPSSTATSLTVRPQRPTCSVTHRPARSVIATRAAAIRASCAVHDPTGHDPAEQAQRCLRHTSRAGRPKHGRSTSRTRRTILHDDPAAAARTRRPIATGLDVDLDRPARDVDDAQHVHVGQADEQLAGTRRVGLHRGSPGSNGIGTTDSVEPL